MIQAAAQVVPLKLDFDKKEVAPISEKYGVSVIPAIIVIDADGKVVGKIEFTTSPATFAADLTRIVKAHHAAPKHAAARRRRRPS